MLKSGKQLENEGRVQKGVEKLRWSGQGWNRLWHKYDDDDYDNNNNNNNNNLG